MTDFSVLRKKMVDAQIAARGITDPGVISAMGAVERHLFVAPEDECSAYEDRPAGLAHGQTVSQPYMVALMTERLGLSGKERVLEIGTGSGYQAAVLSLLAKEVFSLERIPELSADAARRLAALGYRNVRCFTGDGSAGLKQAAPFDRIIVTCACPRIPFPLEEQLAEGGMIVCPVGEARRPQTLLAGKKSGGIIRTETVCECVFVPLIGECGRLREVE